MPLDPERRTVGRRSEEYALIDGSSRAHPPPAAKPGKAFWLSLVVGLLCTVCLLAFFVWYVVPTLLGLQDAAATNNVSLGELGWINRYRGFGAEGSIALVDIDSDGVSDIVYSLAQPTSGRLSIYQAPYCNKYKAGCVGVLVGLRGSDGAELWNLPTKQEVFELNCQTIDIDKDGRFDCLAAGRKATLLALNPRTGKHLWPPQTGGEPHFDNDWNIYSPLTLPDLNGDGVGEVFVAHGGDPLFPPENHTRFPARFMVLSGADGTMLGKFFQSPDGKETYNSPVLHATSDGRSHVLFGTGGETVSGSLYAIPTNQLLCLTRFTECNSTQGAPFIRELYKSSSKGIMVPVVIADVSGDGTSDIVCISFDGTVVVLDGKTYSLLWRRCLPNYESYATPAIGYFNDDERLDIMTVWNLGQWPDYNQCLVLVMDGASGDTLWSFTTSRFSMVSPLVLRTVERHRDAFVIGIEGRTGDYLEDTIGVVHGIDPQRKLKKVQKAEHAGKRSSIACTTSNLDLLAAEVLLVDSSSIRNPLRIWRREVDKFYYDPISYAAVNVSSITEGMLTSLGCEIMQQASRNTGAIGDVDGDGLLDLIVPFGASALLMKDGEYYDERMDVEIVKISLEKHLRSFPTIEINATCNFKSVHQTRLQTVGFFPASKQPWTAYMGTRGDSVYRGG